MEQELLNFLEADAIMHSAVRARKKKKIRSLDAHRRRMQLWLDYMMPYVFSAHLHFASDPVTYAAYTCPKLFVLSNWNLCMSSLPIYSNLLVYPQRIPSARDGARRLLRAQVAKRVEVTQKDHFRKHLLFTRARYYMLKFPANSCWNVFMYRQFGSDEFRLVCYDSNLRSGSTGKFSAPTHVQAFRFHMKYKYPTSVCIGPVIRKVRTRRSHPIDIGCGRVIHPDELEYPGERTVLAYVPREFVMRIDLRHSDRICCGTDMRMCRYCVELLSFFPSVVATILHDVYGLNILTAIYDGQCSVLVVSFDKKMMGVGESERKLMCAVVRCVLCSSSQPSVVPSSFRGVVSRVSEMMLRFLRESDYLRILIGQAGNSSHLQFTHSSRVMNMLKHCGLPEPVCLFLKYMCTEMVTQPAQFLDLCITLMDKIDQCRLTCVGIKSNFLRRIFRINPVGLDELPLKDRIYPAPFSVNPYSNNLCCILQLTYPPGYSLDMLPLPVTFEPIKETNRTLSGDPNFFASMGSSGCPKYVFQNFYSELFNFIHKQSKVPVFDVQAYHLTYHYDKYDRTRAFQKLGSIFWDILTDLELNPDLITHFGTIFKAKNWRFMPCDSQADTPFRDFVITTMKNYFSETRPLNLHRRLLKAIANTSLNVTILRGWAQADMRTMRWCFRSAHPPIKCDSAFYALIRPRAAAYLDISAGFVSLEKFRVNHVIDSLLLQSENDVDGYNSEGYTPPDPPRLLQAEVGWSSGEEYSETSTCTSDYSDDPFTVGPSFNSFAIPGFQDPMLLNVARSNVRSNAQRVVTGFMAPGSTQKRYSNGYMEDRCHMSKHTYMYTRKLKRNRYRYMPYKAPGTMTSVHRSFVHKEACDERTLTGGVFLSYPTIESQRLIPYAMSDIECFDQAEERGSADGCQGHKSKYKAYCMDVSPDGSQWTEDSMSDNSFHPFTSTLFHWGATQHYHPKFKATCRVPKPVMTQVCEMTQYKNNLVMRMRSGYVTNDSGSLWADKSIEENVTYYSNDLCPSPHLRLLRHMRIERKTHLVHTSAAKVDTKLLYMKALEETGIHGAELVPSTDSEGESKDSYKTPKRKRTRLCTYRQYEGKYLPDVSSDEEEEHDNKRNARTLSDSFKKRCKVVSGLLQSETEMGDVSCPSSAEDVFEHTPSECLLDSSSSSDEDDEDSDGSSNRANPTDTMFTENASTENASTLNANPPPASPEQPLLRDGMCEGLTPREALRVVLSHRQASLHAVPRHQWNLARGAINILDNVIGAMEQIQYRGIEYTVVVDLLDSAEMFFEDLMPRIERERDDISEDSIRSSSTDSLIEDNGPDAEDISGSLLSYQPHARVWRRIPVANATEESAFTRFAFERNPDQIEILTELDEDDFFANGERNEFRVLFVPDQRIAE